MKRIESTTCPTCGTKHPSGTVQTFEIPEIPVVDTAKLATIMEQLDALSSAVKSLKMPEIALPKNLDDVCARFPQLCQKVDRLSEGVAKTNEILSGHPKPSPALEKEWEDCKECSGLWRARKKSIGNEVLSARGHPKPTPALGKEWEDCKECSDLWKTWKESIGEEAATKAVEDYKAKLKGEKVPSVSSFPWIGKEV